MRKRTLFTSTLLLSRAEAVFHEKSCDKSDELKGDKSVNGLKLACHRDHANKGKAT
jgi:hypothetical protein